MSSIEYLEYVRPNIINGLLVVGKGWKGKGAEWRRRMRMYLMVAIWTHLSKMRSSVSPACGVMHFMSYAHYVSSWVPFCL